MRTSRTAILLATLSCLACSEPPTVEGDAGDAAVGVDTLVRYDASGMDMARGDAARADTLGAPTDAGPGVDSSVVIDSATPQDTGYTPAEDAGLPLQGDNIIANGSFELWADGLPESWLGDTSNITADSVVEDLSAAHDGVRACQLINESDTHKRFTTGPMSVEAGYYHCFYWARGSGEVRNSRFDGDYASYDSYTTVDADTWTQLRYDFHLADAVADVFELIFSVRNTGAARGHLHIDHVRCTRDIEACDAVSCEAWQRCDEATAACVTASGFCADGDDCLEWQECDGAHTCVTAAGRCAETADCDDPTPACDLATHLCVAGDPCADIICLEWQQCDPADSSCVLAPGRCWTTADCLQDLPVCDVSSHTCVAVDDAVNVVPNGGFEQWEEVSLGGSQTYNLPVSWYGVCDGCSPYFPTSEQAPGDVRPYTASVHGGSTACQLIQTGVPADRFTTEPFTVTPTATYSCAYWVRGQGTHRHRGYCGGWEPDTDYQPIDSDEWQQVSFELNGQASWCVIILYASNTDAARDHVQFDDVVCSRRTP